MADLKQIHEFAVKWCQKFCDPKISCMELIDHFMADDCAAAGFEMDCGHAFFEKYGQAANNHKELEKIINDVTDISLLGSAIYSRWRYFNHWSYSGTEILEPQNRNWFITALTQLEKLSANNTGAEHTIIVFPELATLQAEVEELRTEISRLLLERDELRLVICKNIETAYMLALGSLEYKIFELNCEVLRLKRKNDIIQAKKNHQQKVVLSVIEEMLDEEFAEFQHHLDEQINKMNKAIDNSKGQPLTDKETKEIKMLYRSIAKALHPDLHPELTPAQMQLFHNALQAYENGDLDNLRIISEMAEEPNVPECSENGLSVLVKDKERLTKTMELIRKQISVIKSEYPYTMKELVNSPEQISEKRSELERAITDLKEAYDLYDARIKEMLR